MKFGQTDIFSYFNLSKFLIILILCTNVLLAIYETIWLLLLMSACFLVALYHMTVLNCASRPVGSWQLLYNNKVGKLHQKIRKFYAVIFNLFSRQIATFQKNSSKYSKSKMIFDCSSLNL